MWGHQSRRAHSLGGSGGMLPWGNFVNKASNGAISCIVEKLSSFSFSSLQSLFITANDLHYSGSLKYIHVQ